MIKVMVSDDNIALNSTYCTYLTKDENIQIVSHTIDGETTLQKYLELRPDILLLDLEMPKLNGIEVINQLSLDSDEKHKCNIIVITGHSNLRLNLINTAKVYSIMPKPVDMQKLLDTIKEYDKENFERTTFDKKIKETLVKLNIQPYSNGGIFITEGINIAFKRPKILKNIKDLYYEVGKHQNIPATTVKSSIRNSIDVMNKYITSEQKISFFQIYDSRRTVTPRYFFTLIIENFYSYK